MYKDERTEVLGKELYDKREIFDEYLNSIEVEDNQDAKSGYSITFNFDENPYFDNPSLAKSLTFHEGKLKETKATTIQWKKGKSMPDEVLESDDDNEVCPEKDDELMYEVKLTVWSFFNWFHTSKEQNEMRFPDQVADLIKEQTFD